MLPEDVQREPAETPEPVSPALTAALKEMLRKLDTVTGEIAWARRQIETKRHEQAELTAAIDRTARLLPPELRRGVMVRLAASERRRSERAGRRPAPDPEGRIAAIKRWLVAEDPDSFLTLELTAHLQRAGFRLPEKYAANACRELTRQGILYRLARGRYAINRTHPEICDMILADLDRRMKAF